MNIKTLSLLIAFSLIAGVSTSAYASNYALEFDGVDDLILVPKNDSQYLTNGYTMTAWIKPYSYGGARDILGTQFDSYIFTVRDSGKLRIELGGHGPHFIADLTGNTAIPLNEWTYVASTFSGGLTQLYVNGTLDGTQVGSPGIAQPVTDLFIGGGVSGSFNGMIDDVRIWNGAKNQNDLQYWANQPLTGNEPGLVASWNFDEGTGQVAHNLSPYSNNGQLGYTLLVDGTDPQWVPANSTVPEPSSLLLMSLGGIITAFIKRRRKA